MNKPETDKTVQRRGFFAALGMSGAVAVAAAVTTPKPAEAMTPPGTKGGKHYTDSAHVKKYYEVNRY